MAEEIPQPGKYFIQSYSGSDGDWPVVGVLIDPSRNDYQQPADLAACTEPPYTDLVFTGATVQSADQRILWTFEKLPGPWLDYSRIDFSLGPVQGQRRAVANTGQDASLSGTQKTYYEARDGSAIVSWEIVENYSNGTGSPGNPAFPIYVEDVYDPQRGAVQVTRQIVVATGSEVGTFTNAGGISTKTEYTPYSENPAFLLRSIEVWATPGPYIYGTEIDAATNIQVATTRRLMPNGTRGAIFTPTSTNITGASVAAQTVLTVASTTGFSPGMQITVAGNSNCTPDIDGTHYIVAVGSGTVTIDFQVTSVVSGGTGGTAILSAQATREIQPIDSMQCAEITSQVIAGTLAQATKTWTTQINHSWPPRVPTDGIKLRSEESGSNTSTTGTFETPTTLTEAYSNSYSGDASVQMFSHYGPTTASITREYFTSPPTPSAIDEIKLSTGEIVIQGGSESQTNAYSIQDAGTGLRETDSSSNNYRVVSIPPCLIDVSEAVDGGGGFGQAVFSVDIEDSDPPSLTAGASFVLSSVVTEGRLGLYMRETITLTVPDSFT